MRNTFMTCDQAFRLGGLGGVMQEKFAFASSEVKLEDLLSGLPESARKAAR